MPAVALPVGVLHLLLFATSLLSVALAVRRGSGGARYVLCDDSSEFRPSAPLLTAGGGGGAVLRALSASIAAGGRRAGAASRWVASSSTSPELRVALLVDAHRFAMRMAAPTEESFDPALAHKGHAEHVSYAKCRGRGLPNSTLVGCRILGGSSPGAAFGANATAAWMPGRLARFRNAELWQDFAVCDLEESRLAVVQATTLRLELLVQPVAASGGTVLQLEMCRVTRPLLRASFCSQPLYGLPRLREEAPWVLEDWLAYHLKHLGFQHAELYDVDGSFAEALEPWLRGDGGQDAMVSYHRAWPHTLSKHMGDVSARHPYCAEAWAYAHCITKHRALSRWVALLHAPDEYLFIRSNPSRGVLPDVLQGLEETFPDDRNIAYLQVNAVSFGRGGPGAEASQLAERGGVVATSRVRMPRVYFHLPLIDPANCVAAGPHSCYAEAGAAGEDVDVVTMEVRPGIFLLHHYVEMLAANRGRCAGLHMPCVVPDGWAQWAVRLLRGGL